MVPMIYLAVAMFIVFVVITLACRCYFATHGNRNRRLGRQGQIVVASPIVPQYQQYPYPPRNTTTTTVISQSSNWPSSPPNNPSFPNNAPLPTHTINPPYPVQVRQPYQAQAQAQGSGVSNTAFVINTTETGFSHTKFNPVVPVHEELPPSYHEVTTSGSNAQPGGSTTVPSQQNVGWNVK